MVQRALAADSMDSARRAPLIAAVPKMLFPFLVILPGMIAIAATVHGGASGLTLPHKAGQLDYDMVVPLMLGKYFPSGMLGLGLNALMASFMTGMAGNVTAFSTVWTYDIYQAYIKKSAPDAHYLTVGRMATVVGIALSVGAAYITNRFSNICSSCAPSSMRRCSPRSCSGCSGSARAAMARSPDSSPARSQRQFITV